jgi:hypothetical protein
VLVLSALALGCGAELDPQSELNTLRVLAVQKDEPYAQPGDTVALTMLHVDGSEDVGRPIEIGWFSGCVNPPGDLYQGCFAPGAIDPRALNVAQGVGLTSFSFGVPDDVIARRPPSPDPRQPKYGLAFVFFAACAGSLDYDFQSGSFPILCRDTEGRPLGSANFVAGYSTVYVYESFSNENPIVTGFSFRAVDVDPSVACVGDACLGLPPPSADLPAVTVPACPDDGDPVLCDEHPLRPLVDPESAEPDAIALQAYGRNYTEQLWVSYFTSGGSLRSETRLLNDATRGWNPEYGTDFFAPKTPGPVRVYAAVHDNRGGVAWSALNGLVQ